MTKPKTFSEFWNGDGDHRMEPTSIRYAIPCPSKGCRRRITRWCPHCGMARCRYHSAVAGKRSDCAMAGADARHRVKTEVAP